MSARTKAPPEGGTTQRRTMKTIQVQARQCGKTARMGELAMKAISLGSSTLTVKAWAENRVHVKQLNEEVVPTLQPYQRQLLTMMNNHPKDGCFVRIFLPWR